VSLTQQCHRVGVAGEGADVLLDPVQRGDDVEQRVVAGCVAVARAQETCSPHIDTYTLTHVHRSTHSDLRLARLHRSRRRSRVNY